MNRPGYNRNRNQGNRGRDGGNRRRFQRVQRVKRCAKTIKFNYKNPESLRQYVTSHGRIKPMRLNGLCAKHQRLLAREIKRARHLALIAFVQD